MEGALLMSLAQRHFDDIALVGVVVHVDDMVDVGPQLLAAFLFSRISSHHFRLDLELLLGRVVHLLEVVGRALAQEIVSVNHGAQVPRAAMEAAWA